jgi:hypothetical protein
MLEMKLGYQRLFNLLENYFDPIDSKFDDARNTIIDKYRTTTRSTSLPGGGEGIRQVIPTDDMPIPGAIRSQEQMAGGKGLTRAKSGLPPLKRIYLNPLQLRKAKLLWYVDIDAQPRETSNAKKLLFREELADIMALIQLGSQPNVAEIERQHAIVWNRQREKLFAQQQAKNPAMMQQMQAGTTGARTTMPGGPGTAAAPNTAALSAVGVE